MRYDWIKPISSVQYIFANLKACLAQSSAKPTANQTRQQNARFTMDPYPAPKIYSFRCCFYLDRRIMRVYTIESILMEHVAILLFHTQNTKHLTAADPASLLS